MISATNTEVTTGYVEISAGAILGTAFTAIALYLLFYFLQSFALYRMAKNKGCSHAGFAFIPFYRLYMLGKLAGKIRLGSKVYNDMAIPFTVLVGLTTLVNVLSVAFVFADPFISVLKGVNPGMIFSESEGLIIGYSSDLALTLAKVGNIMSYVISAFAIVTIVFEVFVYSALFKQYTPRGYLVCTIFSVLGFVGITLMVVRNKKPIDYNEYLKSRFANFNAGNPYMNQNQNGYGNGSNYYNNGYYNNNSGSDDYVDPFSDEANESSDANNSDGQEEKSDPFGEN